MTRPTGRSLIVGSSGTPGGSLDVAAALKDLGYTCVEIADPYAAMAELCAQPLSFSSIVLSLNTLFRDELLLISAVKRRFPNVEIWLTRFEGRQSVADEALRLGADGFLDEGGFQRIAPAAALHKTPEPPARPAAAPAASSPIPEYNPSFSEPVLSADELHALLDDAPTRGDAKEA